MIVYCIARIGAWICGAEWPLNSEIMCLLAKVAFVETIIEGVSMLVMADKIGGKGTRHGNA